MPNCPTCHHDDCVAFTSESLYNPKSDPVGLKCWRCVTQWSIGAEYLPRMSREERANFLPPQEGEMVFAGDDLIGHVAIYLAERPEFDGHSVMLARDCLIATRVVMVRPIRPPDRRWRAFYEGSGHPVSVS